VPRLPLPGDDGNSALTRVVVSANQLLDVLDQRGLRLWSHAQRAGHKKVAVLVAQLAQRLLRLARVPGLPPALVDELTSLGQAVGARARSLDAEAGDALLDELARLAPRAPSHLDQRGRAAGAFVGRRGGAGPGPPPLTARFRHGSVTLRRLRVLRSSTRPSLPRTATPPASLTPSSVCWSSSAPPRSKRTS
jgi:hypothetical protein